MPDKANQLGRKFHGSLFAPINDKCSIINDKCSMINVMSIKRKDEVLADRLLDFAVRIINLLGKLPKNNIANHVGLQLLRSGTSPGANY